MYIELVRRVLKEAVEVYAARTDQTVSEVLQQIREHIDQTAREHRKDEPEINYDSPLCRLGYLYRHATANATLFERVLLSSDKLQRKICSAEGGILNICAVGGGPGTELLGLAKYFLRSPAYVPRKITFTVLDNVPYWSETWHQLAKVVEDELRSELADEDVMLPSVAPTFLPMDVVEPTSYENYAFQFNDADIVVFNYLFSENKGRLEDAKEAVRYLAGSAPSGCIFVVIDRRENSPDFTNNVVKIFESVFGNDIYVHTYDGTLDCDEQTEDMGEMLLEILGTPRVKFFTDLYRDPTVFWFVVVKK